MQKYEKNLRNLKLIDYLDVSINLMGNPRRLTYGVGLVGSEQR